MDAAGSVSPTVFLHRQSGRWVVPSRDLAVLTAHKHANILRHVRRVAADPALAGAVFWHEYEERRSGRLFPCAHLAREALAAVFEWMHNVPGCRNIRAVLDEYLMLLDEKEAAPRVPPGGVMCVEWNARLTDRRAGKWLQAYRDGAEPAEPAPDSEILPPDPEPENLFDPVAVPADAPPSWRINAAVLTLRQSGLPRYLSEDLDRWNTERCAALYAAARSWTEAEQIFATKEVE